MQPELITFWKELNGSFRQIGSVIPSSKSLAKDMVRPMVETSGPRRILEVGPGTGPFTKQILKLMTNDDEFVICEINARFMTRLKASLERNRHYQRHRSRVSFFLGPVQQLPRSDYYGVFDIIVCSVPFSNFTPEVTDEIMSVLHRMLSREGKLTFVEYLGARKITRLLASSRDRRRIKGVDAVIDKWRKSAKHNGKVKTSVALLNIPPALTTQFNY